MTPTPNERPADNGNNQQSDRDTRSWAHEILEAAKGKGRKVG
jgi:hypothetical protein